jgi:hypothetical protein
MPAAATDKFPVPAKNSLFGKKNSLFLQEQGIGHKLLSPLGERLPKSLQEAGIVRNFQQFPANFPVLRESSMHRGNVCMHSGGMRRSNVKLSNPVTRQSGI